jgi:UrcA family protein
MTRNRTIAIILASAALAVAAVPAAAQVRGDGYRVTWNDLDLTTTAGAQELDRRIDRTARRACRGARTTGSNISDMGFCRAAFRTEVMNGMSQRARQDYAVSRAPEVL